jgi:hypothetical protein
MCYIDPHDSINIALYTTWSFAHGTVRVICCKEKIEKGMGCKVKEGLILERRGKLEERIFFLDSKSNFH